MNSTQIQTMGPGLICMRFDLTYQDFQAGTLTSTNHISTVKLSDASGNAFPLALGSLIFGYRMKHATAFGGGSVSAATVSIGSSAASSATTFAAAFDVHQAVADATFAAGATAAPAGTYAADTITATLTLTSDVVANMTAGELYIDLFISLWDNMVGTAPVGCGGTAGAPVTGSGFYGV